MYGNCKKCDEDVYELMNWNTLCQDFIECPKCGHKMKVCYDEVWNGEEEYQYWWLENYKGDIKYKG